MMSLKSGKESPSERGSDQLTKCQVKSGWVTVVEPAALGDLNSSSTRARWTVWVRRDRKEPGGRRTSEET